MADPATRPAARERLITILSPILILVAWEAAAQARLIDTRFVPAPSTILATGWTLLKSGELLVHIGATLYRLALGFSLGTILGIALGMAMGLNRFVRAAIDPIVAAIYPIPKIAIFPLLMLAFGLGDGSKIVVVALTVFLLTTINTMTGVLSIERAYFDVARNFRSPRSKLYSRLIIPAILPIIFSGLRIGLGTALVVLVATEFVASQSGIGYLIWNSWQLLLVDQMFVGIICITVLGLCFTAILKELERYFTPWR
jgi:NitT/TauT family transport system permease protein